MILNVMSVAYERPIPMRILIDCFLVQTNPNWKLTIVHDGKASEAVNNITKLYDDPRIIFKESDQRYQQYGHPNRKIFLSELKGNKDDFVLLTNDDNYYVPVFVDEVLNLCKPDIGMVYCDAVHSHFQYNVLKTQVRVDRIDIGSFAVREDIAKAVGFNNFAFNGDGFYAEECALRVLSKRLQLKYIPKCFLIHN